MGPPYGLRSLFLTCHDPGELQFRKLGALLRRVARSPGAHLVSWTGERLDLSRRRVLTRVLVSGHGNEEQARFAAPGIEPLGPEDLRLCPGCRLYLLGCGQGKPELLHSWAEGTGLPSGQVSGCSGETDTAVSTCLALHLLEEGIEALDRWFPVWERCNAELRPHFPAIRQAYLEHGTDPVVTLRALAGRLELEPYREFLSVIDRHPEYLRGLMEDPRPERARPVDSGRVGRHSTEERASAGAEARVDSNTVLRLSREAFHPEVRPELPSSPREDP